MKSSLTCVLQRDTSMLTFEGAQVQGAQAIVDKLVVSGRLIAELRGGKS